MPKVNRNGVIVDYSGWERLLKRLEVLERKEIRWGIFNKRYGADHRNRGAWVAGVAKANNDGTYGGPARPFFDTNVDRNATPADPLGKRTQTLLRNLVAGTMTNKTSTSDAAALGKHLQESLQQEILDFAEPRNADTTIERKGFNDPLIETGTMYDSVEYRVVQSRLEKQGDA